VSALVVPPFLTQTLFPPTQQRGTVHSTDQQQKQNTMRVFRVVVPLAAVGLAKAQLRIPLTRRPAAQVIDSILQHPQQ